MLVKTRGIVINHIKFKDTSIISKVYTEKLGIQSYIVNGIRSKQSKQSLGLFQPLTLLDIVAYSKKGASKSGISRLSEYKCLYPFRSIPYQIKKTTVAMFMAELLSKLIREEEEDYGGQFNFVCNAIILFDRVETGYENFHLRLMIHLANYIGFGIQSKDQLYSMDTHFVNDWSEDCYDYIVSISVMPFENDIVCSNTLRQEVLNYMLTYYESHLENFGEMKSLSVLKQLFSS